MKRAVRGARNQIISGLLSGVLTGVPVSPLRSGHLSFVVPGLVKVPVVLIVLQ